VNDLVLVGDLQGIQHLAQQRYGLLGLIRLPRRHGVREVRSLEQLHRHDPVVVYLLDGEHLHDVRMS
jgi:hypothetical protein